MFSYNNQFLQHGELQRANANQQLAYYQPEVYYLGSIKMVQSCNNGWSHDGPSSWYWYNRSGNC